MLAVIGEALVDLVDSGDRRTYVAHPGGSPLNVAVGLARLGHPTQLMARLSSDNFGRLLREHAERNGVGLAAAVHAPQPSSLAVATLDAQRRARYDFYFEGAADWQWTAAELDVPPGTRILHTGSLASWTAPGDARIAELLRQVRDTMLVSYDPNVRPSLLGTPARARPLVERMVAVAHLVKASDDDVAWLYPGEPPGEAARRWLDLGASTVVITCGEHGAIGYRRGAAPIERPGRPVVVADTIGAGDAFTSGLHGALARATRPQDAELSAAMDEAILVASLTCERAGADPPTAAELAAARAAR